MCVSVQGSGLTDRRTPPDSPTKDPKAFSTVMGGRGGLGPGQLALTYPQRKEGRKREKERERERGTSQMIGF